MEQNNVEEVKTNETVNTNVELSKKQDEVIQRTDVRSAYDTPSNQIQKDPAKIALEKEKQILMRQQDYEKIVQKVRAEEQKNLAEQEKIIEERNKKEQIEKAKEEQRKINEEKIQQERIKKEEEVKEAKENGSFIDKINAVFTEQKLSDKKKIELQAKAEFLNEQFKDKDAKTTRLEKPLVFSYEAKNPSGKIEKGQIEALSRMDVYSFLLAEGYEVYEIKASKSANISKVSGRPIKRSKLTFYLSQLSAYLKSGIVLADAVKILADQAKNINEKNTWRAVYYDLSMGDILSSAFEKRGKAFPKLLVNMIKTAEMTGNLPETLDDMVDYYTELENNYKEMKSAMTYPIVISVFALAVVIFMVTYIVPQFTTMYDQLDSTLPLITRMLISISNFAIENGVLILSVTAAIVIFLIICYKNIQPIKKSMQVIFMKIPVFGNIVIYNEITTFCSTFANLLNHNVFITDSMDILGNVTENEVYKGMIYDATRNLVKGDVLSKAFKDKWAFPNIAYQMMITGEKTGRLGSMLEKVAAYYKEQHRNLINQMKSLIEPFLIIFLAFVVGGIILSVLLPMFDMYTKL